MRSYITYFNDLVNQCKKYYGKYSNIKWITASDAIELQEKRDLILHSLKENQLFKNTKVYHQQISKGCQLCGLGLWSCLFITGKCNASCFYCPTSQLIDEVPSSQGLLFPTANAYAEYVNHFKFKGVGFSGGEPFLAIDRVFQYLKKLRKVCDPDLYIWMYTNGILADTRTFKKLASLKLNEIRFDIGASNYSLEKVKLAKGIIPNITIEIPIVPEETEKIKALLPEMIKAGVSNLNLHQLRLTPYNAEKLLKRGYTFLPAERPIVLESELAALEIIRYTKENNIKIGINYCSFFFKNRFQKAGFRNQIANSLAGDDEFITQNGYIRTYSPTSVQYEGFRLLENAKVNDKLPPLILKYKTYTVQRSILMEKQVSENNKNAFLQLFGNDPQDIPEDDNLFETWRYEYIERNLRDY